MDNNLDIQKEISGNELRIILKGRLDASWAGHLDDYLNSLIREGSYHIILNMAGVQYLSSAGIRILFSQYKKIRKIGGSFALEELSGTVSEVLEMVGMRTLLTKGEQVTVPVEIPEPSFLVINGYRFDYEVLSDKTMTLSLNGNPGLISTSGYSAADNQKIRFTGNKYGIGIGAIGDGFVECKSRYGEFIAPGDSIIYKPSDGSKIPDYIVKSGKLEPEINTLYSIIAEGAFSNRINFEPAENCPSISLDGLISRFAEICGQKHFVFLLIAESDGLVGVSLNTSPVEGNKLFEFPNIRENVNFTTEPAYSKMLTVSLGVYSVDPEEPLKAFLRPVSPGSSACIHTHAAVFPYQALHKREPSAGTLILHLLESSIVQDVLHLINDSREITGMGNSTFKRGVAWIGKFN